MSADSVAKSIGHHAHWGFSSGFDFLEAILQACPSRTLDTNQPINILLVQPGDIRHVILTISRRRRHIQKCGGRLPDINFYLLESPIEVLARDALLLQVLTDYTVPIRQRSNTFLEIFGNNKVQRRTSEYIEALSKQLLQLSSKGTGTLQQFVDFSQFNYREKDMFESALRSYATTFPFDMDNLYDHRQRAFYEDRFDARRALFDWDYHAGIIKKASIIHIKQYRQWRMNGIAFEFGDQTYNEPNRTLMTYTEGFMKKGKEKGLKKEVQGFWGDIVCSPYFALGVDCDTPNKHAEGLFEILNKNTGTEQHRHHAVEIALYNMYSMLTEIETGAVYKMSKPNDIYSGLGQQDKQLEVKAAAAEVDSTADVEDKDGEGDEGEREGAAEGQKDLVDMLAEEAEQAAAEEEEKKKEKAAERDGEGQKQEHTAPLPDPPATKPQSIPPPPPSAFPEPASAHAAKLAALEKRKKREAALARAIQRAETIAESNDGIKMYPMTGTLSHLVGKARHLQGQMDGIFVSSRVAQVLSEPGFRGLCRGGAEAPSAHCVVAVESAKFLVALKKDTQQALTAKEEELALQNGFQRIPAPVFRRRRDELDVEDDVIFLRPVPVTASAADIQGGGGDV